MKTFWRLLFYLWLLSAIAAAGVAGVAQGEVGEAIFAVSFFWLGMPWTALLALAPWADLLIQIALVLAVLINLALLHRLGRRAAARARPATVVDTG